MTIIAPIILSCLFTIFYFSKYLFTGSAITGKLFLATQITSLVITPIIYLLFMDVESGNPCCDDNAAFSPEHRTSIYVVIGVCLVAYFYSGYRRTISTPVVEVIINALLIAGIALNVLIIIHEPHRWLSIFGCTPIILLFIMQLARNQQVLLQQMQQGNNQHAKAIERTALKILSLKPFLKFPLLIVLCLPILVIITAVLLLAGQKPDSMIMAFTDTYKHGLSQLDLACNNVDCGGHFLCSVAAKGHKRFVKPTRLGVRNEQLILCNRQLLISNAFEDLLQQKLPFLHKPIRHSYNHVGDLIHRHYRVFNNKWVCDIIYILMKPAEWIFLLTLYTFDKKPENRIAKQYISSTHRQQLNESV